MEGVLEVTGARIFYRTTGAGPVLMLLPGGAGDADAYAELTARLESDFTVVAFDRRGLSRSSSPARPATLSVHADDAAAVLAAVTDAPAAVFGSSIGAVVALELLTRHPGAVRVVLAHEPPLSALLPEPDRSALAETQREIEQTHRTAGVAAAMSRFAQLIELDPTDREDGTALPIPDADSAANLTYFLTHDAPAVRRYHPDPDALRQHASKLLPAVGTTTTGIIPSCTHALANLLGINTISIPGGHLAPSLRPHAVAEVLRLELTRR
ncbi:alpha/beta hydrolase [Nocardia blacklockiae]|uniref:alpha/beta hydrolase n=1 Tax=Nocardia blacklockiae TaxID=480036 RepID=UPI001E543CB7|nr:alpha/beta hydrolase [Nocardia blacklockiae]